MKKKGGSGDMAFRSTLELVGDLCVKSWMLKLHHSVRLPNTSILVSNIHSIRSATTLSFILCLSPNAETILSATPYFQYWPCKSVQATAMASLVCRLHSSELQDTSMDLTETCYHLLHGRRSSSVFCSWLLVTPRLVGIHLLAIV